MKTAVVIITLANILMYSIALLVIYHKSRPKLRDKYNLREMYESDTGKKYETKKYLKWLSGFLLLVLSLGVSAQSGKIPLRQIANIDTTTIVKSSWQTYIERLQPTVNTYWYSDPNGIRYDGNIGINKPSSNYYRLDINGQVSVSSLYALGELGANGVWMNENTITVEGRTYGPGTPPYDTEGRIWMNYNDQKLYFTNYTDTYDLTAAGSGGTYTGWNVLTNGTFRKSIASGNNVNFAAGTGMAIAYSSSNNTLTFTSSGGSTTGQWADDVNGINYIGEGVKGRVGIGNSSVNIYTLNVDKSISGGWAANFQNSNTQGHGIRINTGNNNNSYAAIFAQSSLGSIFELTNAGRLRLTRYGSGTFNGTPTRLLGVDASGNVIETTGTGSYSLPLASSTTRGGIKVGFDQVGNSYPVLLSSEKAYVSLPDATVSLKGIASFSSSNFAVTSGAVAIKAKGINASLLNAGNTPLSGYVPTYNSTTGGFTWAPMESGGGGGNNFNNDEFVITTDIVYLRSGGIIADRLKASNSPTSGYVPTYNSSTGGFTWAPQLSLVFNTTQFDIVGNTIILKDGGITAQKLKASNSPTAGNVPTYNSVTGGFTWAPMESGGGLWTDAGTYLYPTSNKPIKTRGYATEIQAVTTTLNYNNGAKATMTISANTSITITNLPDGGEGQIEVKSEGTGNLTVQGSTGYTVKKLMGNNKEIKKGTVSVPTYSTIVYWRSGNTLYYGYIHENIE